jgi:hypothetical protein
VNDRILEINYIDVKEGTKEDVMKIIAASPNHVSLLVSREIEPTIPFNSMHGRLPKHSKHHSTLQHPSIWQEFTLRIAKVTFLFYIFILVSVFE